MTPPSDNDKNNPFPAFAFGLTLGIVGALAFGTEEGRKIVNKLIDSIPNKYKTPPVNTQANMVKTPIIPLEETPHHAEYEAPPSAPACDFNFFSRIGLDGCRFSHFLW